MERPVSLHLSPQFHHFIDEIHRWNFIDVIDNEIGGWNWRMKLHSPQKTLGKQRLTASEFHLTNHQLHRQNPSMKFIDEIHR